MGAFTKLFSRLRITSDPNVSTQTSAVITADSGNTNLVIAPSGTGALIAQIPDGTATGGNARGSRAVDFQMARANANQVAGGDLTFLGGGQENFISASVSRSAIVNGYQNITNSGFTFIGSGAYNTVGLNSVSSYSAIVSGNSNKINYGTNSFIGSGDSNIISAAGGGGIVICGGSTNTASTSYSTISGGQNNTASTNTHATVVGGQQNVASGPRATVGGEASTSSGQVSTAFGYQAVANGYGAVYLGFQGTSSGSYAFSGGIGHTASARSTVCLGESNTASAQSAIALGTGSKAYLFGQKSIANGIFTAVGDAQQSQTTSRREAALTTGGTTVLSLDGGGGPSNTLIPDGNNRMWNVTIKYVAVVTTITGTATGVTVGDTKSQNIEIGFKKVGGVSSLVGGGSFSIPQEDASMSSASLIPTAGAFQQLALTFTAPTFSGGGSVTCRVVAKVELVEVAY